MARAKPAAHRVAHWTEKFIDCGYCGESVRIKDLPNTSFAECFDCLLKSNVKMGWWPPKLPWWRVSAW